MRIVVLKRNALLDPRQFAFRRSLGTQSALLSLTESIRVGANCGNKTLLVLFNFLKAFDSVWHDVVLEKLQGAGCNDVAMNWIWSYLTGRSQAVLADGVAASS